jgi:mannose-6-phosphate isomerase-like protein (cupin superfamily)
MNKLPSPLTHEMLQLFVQGQLDAKQADLVMKLAITNPEVAAEVDVLKREAVDKVIAEAKAQNPDEFIASGILEAFVHGGLTEQEQQFVELMTQMHPTVATELDALEHAHARLLLAAKMEKQPQERSKARFLSFMDLETVENKESKVIRPPFLHGKSRREDYDLWVNREGISPPEVYDNLFVQPLDANAEYMTLLVWVKKEIGGEVHLDAVEKFLVLEGTCMIDIEGSQFSLQAGDYMSIPKFKEHTVYVTSETPCKLIVQQIAA